MFRLSVSGGAAGGDAWGRVGIFMAEADSAQDIGGFSQGRGTGVADCVRGSQGGAYKVLSLLILWVLSNTI